MLYMFRDVYMQCWCVLWMGWRIIYFIGSGTGGICVYWLIQLGCINILWFQGPAFCKLIGLSSAEDCWFDCWSN